MFSGKQEIKIRKKNPNQTNQIYFIKYDLIKTCNLYKKKTFSKICFKIQYSTLILNKHNPMFQAGAG